MAAPPAGAVNPRIRPALLGAATFALATLLLKPLAHTAIGLPASGALFVLGGALIAGLSEELARAGALRWGRLGDLAAAQRAFAFAVGYALTEAVLVGVIAPLQLMHLAEQPAVVASLPAAQREAVERQIAAIGALTPLWLLIERTGAAVAQMGFGWLVWQAIAHRRLAWVGGAIALHAAIDVPAAGFQSGWWPLWAVELLYLGIALLAAPRVVRAWRAALSPAPAPAATSG